MQDSVEPETEVDDTAAEAAGAAGAAGAGANCDQFTFVLYVFVLGAICLFGLVGNTLSFLVLRADRRVHVATFLLQVPLALARSLAPREVIYSMLERA